MPRVRVDSPVRSGSWWIATGLTIVVILAWCLWAIWMPAKPASSPHGQPTVWPSQATASQIHGRALPPTMASLRPGDRLATDLAAEYAQHEATLAHRYQGQRLRIWGQVMDQQSGASGVRLVSLSAGQGRPPLRLVMAQAYPAQGAESTTQPLVFDCLHGGIMLGEPLLSDCRLVQP